MTDFLYYAGLVFAGVVGLGLALGVIIGITIRVTDFILGE